MYASKNCTRRRENDFTEFFFMFLGEYHCPHCWTLQEPVESGATLIVSPSSISYQWIEEIQKHIKHKNVRMLFYKGTKTAGYIQPQTLANYDIVVTTYQVLQSETNYVDLPHSNSAEGRSMYFSSMLESAIV